MDNQQKFYDLGFKNGYINGFEKGLATAKNCANCELIKDCPDYSPKANYCPHSEIKS